MTSQRQRRIAVLQHARGQRALLDALAELGVTEFHALPAEESFLLLQKFHATVVSLRKSGALTRSCYAKAMDALHAFLTDDEVARNGVWELHGPEGQGFFRGTLAFDQLIRWLAAGHEGFGIVMPDLRCGRLLDCVVDDPLDGTFVEIESWGVEDP